MRGYEREQRRARAHAPQVGERSHRVRVHGNRRAQNAVHRIEFDTDAGTTSTSRRTLFRVTLQRRETATCASAISLDGDAAARARTSAASTWSPRITARWTGRLHADLHGQRVLQPRACNARCTTCACSGARTTTARCYPAAGTPWFDALFGRDSCIVSMQMLAYQPEMARSTLRLLAKWQGTELDPSRDEEPGKILHELRFDELSRAGELPYGPYYGSDRLDAAVPDARAPSTTRGRPTCARARAAAGDPGGDRAGWTSTATSTATATSRYEKRSAKGPVNQGWKDSYDAVMHADGTLARRADRARRGAGLRVRRSHAAWRRSSSAWAKRDLAAAAARGGGAGCASSFNDDFWMPEQTTSTRWRSTAAARASTACRRTRRTPLGRHRRCRRARPTSSRA